MSRIHTLKIYNYRGIEHFEHVFNNQFFVCLIGRGDSQNNDIRCYNMRYCHQDGITDL